MTVNPASVVSALASGRKATQLYPVTHPSFVAAIDALIESVGPRTGGGPFVLNLYQGRLYHDSTVIPEEGPGVRAIAEAFEARGLESLSIHPGFARQDAIGLVDILGLRPGPELDIEQELAARSITTVSVALLADDSEEREERARLREQDRSLHHRLASILRTIGEQVNAGGSPDARSAEALVAAVLERMDADPAAVVGLTTLRSDGEPALFHSINVMIHALTLGRGIGLPAEGLTLLGRAALTHDIGKVAFDRHDPTQAEAMRVAHTAVGAEILGGLPDEDRTLMLVAYEHHMHVDGTGFPNREGDYVAHPFSRMVAIANRYDNLVNPEAGEPLTPDRAVIQLLRESGTLHDAMYARIFSRAIGAFPVGSLVRLSDHSVAVVSRAGEDVLAPFVRVIWDDAGMRVEEPVEEDLAGSDRAIVEVVRPESLDATISEHL